MLPCNPTWVKWEEVLMAKAMVFIAINLTRIKTIRERGIDWLNLDSLSLQL